MYNNRASLIAGTSLILLGAIFLVTTIFHSTWPVLLIGLGALLLVAALIYRLTGLVVSGVVNLTLGAILLYQSITQQWTSWYFLWPLLLVAAGAGMLLTRVFEPASADWRSPGFTRHSIAWLALGVLACVGLGVFRAQLHWPSLLWSIGALLLLAAPATGVSPLAIPGVFLGGLGGLMAWQLATGAWDSWAYTWALIPAFTGVGMLLAFPRSRPMRIISLSITGWSLVMFVIFGVFFAADGTLARLWPVILIVGGAAVLAQALLLHQRSPKPDQG